MTITLLEVNHLNTNISKKLEQKNIKCIDLYHYGRILYGSSQYHTVVCKCGCGVGHMPQLRVMYSPEPSHPHTLPQIWMWALRYGSKTGPTNRSILKPWFSLKLKRGRPTNGVKPHTNEITFKKTKNKKEKREKNTKRNPHNHTSMWSKPMVPSLPLVISLTTLPLRTRNIDSTFFFFLMGILSFLMGANKIANYEVGKRKKNFQVVFNITFYFYIFVIFVV